MGEAEGGICSGKLIGGRYRLLSMLGRGGMAQVWRAVDQRLDREVAVKILDARETPDACERFKREARTAAALTHAAIVALHDAGSDDGVDYLVMELVAGETLSHRIRRGPLSLPEITDITGQICDALAAAHSAGIVHRDIKPGNILITETGRVKVCDFGIACHNNEALDATSEMAVGTAQYMAPEQARGGPATPRTDLYGLGCVIYAMATGHPPFAAKTSARVAWQHVNETPVPLASRRPDLPSWLDRLVRSLLAKEPAERPASAADVRGMLPPLSALSARKSITERANLPAETALLTGEPTVRLALAGPLMGRIRLATMGVMSFLGLAAVLLVFTAVSANDMPSARIAQPPASSPASAAPPAAQSPAADPPAPQAQVKPVSDPVNALDALRAALDDQVRAGTIGRKPLKDLEHKLDEIERELARGEQAKAADKLDDFAKKLAELSREGRIATTAASSLQVVLGDLAEQLPHTEDHGDHD